jgi:hypothetical protein
MVETSGARLAEGALECARVGFEGSSGFERLAKELSPIGKKIMNPSKETVATSKAAIQINRFLLLQDFIN